MKYIPVLAVILILLLFLVIYETNFKKEYFTTNINQCYANVMTKNQDKILNQLIKIWSSVAEELNIRWSICAGTYIGAIRHKGRIPWDDDFDITILEEDVIKLKNANKFLNKYNVSIVTFWGGYKIFFNDHRGMPIKKNKQNSNYPWNWPFIDIFTTNDKSPDCNFLEKNELPLKKIKFGDTSVYLAENFNKSRPSINNTKWKKEILDTGYRHQIEKRISSKCEIKKI